MSVSLYTQSCEDATITLTNCEAGSDEKLLQWRDLRVLGVNSTTVNGNTRQIQINFGDNSDIDYYILGNLTTSAAVTIELYENVPGWTKRDTVASATYTNENLLVTASTVASVGNFRIDIVPDTTSSVSLSCVFLGNSYAAPVNYQSDNNRSYTRRYEKMLDHYGYGYSHTWNSATKQIYDFAFHFTEAQLTTLKTQFEYIDFGAKRFWIKDTGVDSNIHLAEWAGDAELTGDHIAAGYYRIPFMAREV